MVRDPEFDDPRNPYAAPKSDPRLPGRGAYMSPAGPARIRFGAIGQAWGLAMQRWGTWALIMLVFNLCVGGASLPAEFGRMIHHGGMLNRANPPDGTDLVLEFVGLLLQLVVQAFLMSGIYRVACRQVRGEPFSVGDMFSAGDVYWPFLGGMALYGLAMMAGLLLCVIPGFIVLGRLIFVQPLIAEGRLSPWEAISASWNALGGQTLAAIGFVIATTIVSASGFLLCCVGVLVTAPVHFLSIAVLFHDFFARKPTAAEWMEPA
jgi:hypothetical protein